MALLGKNRRAAADRAPGRMGSTSAGRPRGRRIEPSQHHYCSRPRYGQRSRFHLHGARRRRELRQDPQTGPAPSHRGDPAPSGSSGGTPRYIAPEQARGQTADARTDIYSFGATLFELIAGRAPFIEGNLMHHHMHTPAPALQSVAPDISDALNELVMHCLAKDPAQRFQSAGELLSYARAAGLL